MRLSVFVGGYENNGKYPLLDEKVDKQLERIMQHVDKWYNTCADVHVVHRHGRNICAV